MSKEENENENGIKGMKELRAMRRGKRGITRTKIGSRRQGGRE